MYVVCKNNSNTTYVYYRVNLSSAYVSCDLQIEIIKNLHYEYHLPTYLASYYLIKYIHTYIYEI